MRKGVPDKQIKALALAFAGAVLAAVAAMFVPVAMLENFTGASGLSELVPAAAAPLGDTARALIAFAAGAFTLAILAYLLLRQEAAQRVMPGLVQVDEAPDAVPFKNRLARIALPKMPWAKGEDDITDLADLPKLRNNDAHPDAPPRRPLSAHQDLPVLHLIDAAPLAPEAENAGPDNAEDNDIIVNQTPGPDPKVTLKPDPIEATEPAIPPQSVANLDVQPTLAEMVAQLEAAVAERQQQLAELEAVAAQLGAGQPAGGIADGFTRVDAVIEPVRTERPPLEPVPNSVKDDDMDSALTAALATLRRMNGTDR